MKYDLCVLGGGPAGYSAALHAASLKMRVILLTGGNDRIGGTCLNEGCIPLKIWNTAARYIRRQSQSEKLGFPSAMLSINWRQTFRKLTSNMPENIQSTVQSFLKTTPLEEFVCEEKNQRINWRQLHQYTKTTCENLRADMRTCLKIAGITVLEEKGSLLDAHRIVSASATIDAINILLATGATEKKAGSMPAISSLRQFDELPSRLAISGAGVLGCELAAIFNKLGSKIILLEKKPRILLEWDEECAQWLHDNMVANNIEIVCNWNGADPPTQHVMLNAVGRAPATANLGLETVGIEVDARGRIIVNDYQQTSVPNVYAAGDICNDIQTASIAEIQGCQAVESMAGRQPFPPVKYHAKAVFSIPELASVGLTSEQCEAEKIPFATAKYPLGALKHTLIDADYDGFVKVIYETKFRKLLGVHIAGGAAAEMIAAANIAVNAGCTIDDYGRLSWIHPSYGEALNRVAGKAMIRYRN